MFQKQLVDDRVNSARKEGLDSQEAARARLAGPRKPGLIARIIHMLRRMKPSEIDTPDVRLKQNRSLHHR